jgi:hypothetical protein
MHHNGYLSHRTAFKLLTAHGCSLPMPEIQLHIEHEIQHHGFSVVNFKKNFPRDLAQQIHIMC